MQQWIGAKKIILSRLLLYYYSEQISILEYKKMISREQNSVHLTFFSPHYSNFFLLRDTTLDWLAKVS